MRDICIALINLEKCDKFDPARTSCDQLLQFLLCIKNNSNLLQFVLHAIYRSAQTSPEQTIEQYASLLINSYSDISIRKYVIAIMIDCIEHTDALSDDCKNNLSKFYSVAFDGKNLENDLIIQIL